MNSAAVEAYVAPYVHVRHAIHLLYATSPYSRDGRRPGLNHRFDKNGAELPLELYGCGCGLCASRQTKLRRHWQAR